MFRVVTQAQTQVASEVDECGLDIALLTSKVLKIRNKKSFNSTLITNLLKGCKFGIAISPLVEGNQSITL